MIGYYFAIHVRHWTLIFTHLFFWAFGLKQTLLIVKYYLGQINNFKCLCRSYRAR